MQALAFFLGQITLVLSLVLIQSTLQRAPQKNLRAALIRAALEPLRALLCLLAAAHLCIGIAHKLLLKNFGVTFSPQVWQHFDRATFELAAQSWPATTLAAGLGIALLPLLYWFVSWRIALGLKAIAVKRQMPTTLLVGAAYATFLVRVPHIPTRLFVESAHASFFKKAPVEALSLEEKDFLRNHGIEPISSGQVKFTALKPNPMARNLIVVYLEAFDILYTNIAPGGFKDLTPNINRLAQKSTVFRHWYPAGGWTIAALFGTHCGTQLDPGANNGNAFLVEKFSEHSPVVCYTDILKQAGFKTVFMGGASPRFSGKGDFLFSNGYSEVVGREWFENSNELKTKMQGWGLLDWELFNEAAEKAIALHKSKERFLLTLLTLNTHQPGYPQNSARGPFPPTAGTDPLRQGAVCTDKALQKFLDRLEAEGVLKDTAVWLQSDHPQFQTEAKKLALGEKGVTNTELVSILKVPKQKSQNLIETPATGFDFPASALDLLGVSTTGRFQRGVSVFSPEFKNRTATASAFDFQFAEKHARPEAHQEDCTPYLEKRAQTQFPRNWSGCAFSLLQHLASIDQREVHYHPGSLTEVLSDLRFEVNPNTQRPSVFKHSDPSKRNLLLFISEQEAADTETEPRPYALEFSPHGDLLATRKLQFNQPHQCQSKDATHMVVFENSTVDVKNCLGSKRLSRLKISQNQTGRLAL